MGSLLTRKDGRRVIQWIDGNGKLRQETLKIKGLDGEPLSARSVEQLARRRIAELEEKARRQRHGLEPLPSDALSMPFGQLMDSWWESKGKLHRSDMVKCFTEKHLRRALGTTPLREVTTARLQRLLADAAESLAPRSLNLLRSFLHDMFEVARQAGGVWEGRVNPATAVPPLEVPDTPRSILALNEWPAVLAEVPETWRGVVAVALYAGLREGEIFGLRREDVDLERGTITVAHSWDGPPKGRKVAPVPIADELRPHLARALAESRSAWVFPAPDGKMHSRRLRLGGMLRAAIGRAGLVEGHEHSCRAHGCGFSERRPEALTERGTCPRCGKPTLWSKPIPRHVRFHDTRHSFGAVVVRGAGAAVAQRALRHADVSITVRTYGHVEDSDVREGLARSLRAPDYCARTASPAAGAPAEAFLPGPYCGDGSESARLPSGFPAALAHLAQPTESLSALRSP